MAGLISGALGGLFRSGELVLASKEFFDIAKTWMKKNEEKLLDRVFLERKFSELKEEILFFILQQRLTPAAKTKIGRLLDFLSSRGKTEDIQAIQNVVFAQTVFETRGIPIGKQVSATEPVGGAEVVKLDDLKTSKAQEFLEQLAQTIGETGKDENFQEAMKLLERNRFIGQDPLRALFTEFLGKVHKELPATLTKLPEKVTTFLKEEFPVEEDSGAVAEIDSRIRKVNDRLRAHLEKRRRTKGF